MGNRKMLVALFVDKPLVAEDVGVEQGADQLEDLGDFSVLPDNMDSYI